MVWHVQWVGVVHQFAGGMLVGGGGDYLVFFTWLVGVGVGSLRGYIKQKLHQA